MAESVVAATPWKAPHKRGAAKQQALPARGAAAAICILAASITAFSSQVAAEAYNNIPRSLQGSEKAPRIQKPSSPKAERCTRKCVSTCIAGGAGAPGEGPLNIRRPLVVFKEGFRTRRYCLVECSDICNLIGDGDDGP